MKQLTTTNYTNSTNFVKHSVCRFVMLLALFIVHCTLFISSAQAQDAFYIYRNDGQFDGFFFDEIKRMGVSKFDLDSIEHDVYVVQEIELADTTYRIPLAAIDSIGFQQPETRFNPKVKFISKCGLLPYIEGGSESGAVFYDVPDNLRPQIGDVLVGLPTDEKGEDVNYVDGSFCCVVERIVTDRSDSRRIHCYGHAPENFGDVFEQYIAIEELGYDKDGNLVRRRVAGIPHRENGKTGEYELFHIQGTIQREWNPDDNTSIALAADVDVAYRVRLTYDIGWSRFFLKLTRDLAIDVSPSLSMAVSRNFEASLGNFDFPLRIWFPTECPIFELEPYPDFFVRGGGKLEAKLNFPKTYIRFGEDIIFDSNRLFPIDYDLHRVPKKDTNSDDIIDIGSTNVTLSGYVQTGIKFHVSIGTASWFKKLFHCDLGFDIYAGPKIEGQMEFSTDWLNNEGFSLYNQLNKTNLTASWLSVDLEAKTTASVLWRTPMEKTFFSTNFPFFPDTLRLIPRLTPEVIVTDNNVRVILHSMHDTALSYNKFKVYIKGAYSNTENFVNTIGEWGYIKDQDIYTGTCPINELKAGRNWLCSTTTWAGHTLEEQYLTSFYVPYTMELNTNRLVFEGYDPSGWVTQSVRFKTNCPRNEISIPIQGRYWCDLETINEAEGEYLAKFKVKNNTDVFSPERKDTVYIRIGSGDYQKYYYIECVQKRVQNLDLLALSFNSYNGATGTFSGDDATITLNGDNSIIVTYSKQRNEMRSDGSSTYIDVSMSCVITQYISQGTSYYVVSDGEGKVYTKTTNSDHSYESTRNYTFGPLSSEHTVSKYSPTGNLTESVTNRTYSFSTGETKTETYVVESPDYIFHFNIDFK